MKKFLIAGSSLAAVAAAGSAGAVDVTLGGSIDMGVEFGVGKNKGDLGIGAASDIVGVKINSSWQSVGATLTGYSLTVGPVAAATVCKVAGRATASSTLTVSRMTAGGAASASDTASLTGTGYLPAGHVIGGTAALTAGGAVVTSGGVDMDGTGTAAALAGDVYAGPFMSVMLRSSATKMVVGAACVEGIHASSTNFFLNNASKIVTASDASIVVEGGFGKITLQTGDYAGGVSAIGDAGDAADLHTDGLAVIMEGVGLLGANPFVAIDLAPAAAPANLEILTGGTIDMGGLSAAVDVAISSSDVVDILSWDLGLDYSLGDMAVSFAYDSQNDWGMSASMAIAGFGVDATIYNKASEDHAKNGLFYSVAASTSLNGFGLSLGVDQDMEPTVSLSKSMGGLSLYAGYDAADEGGKVGATLSF